MIRNAILLRIIQTQNWLHRRRDRFADENGVVLVEYCILATLVAVPTIIAAEKLGVAIGDALDRAAQDIADSDTGGTP